MKIDSRKPLEDIIEDGFVESLKWHIRVQSDPNNDPYETVDNKAHLVASLLKTLEYYSYPEDYKDFLKEFK